MISLTRIESSNIQLGNSYVLGNIQKEKEEADKIQREALKSAQKQVEEIINQANIQAAQILEAANHQVQEMIQQSQEDANQAKEDGYQAGYNAGYQDGHNQVHEDLINQVKSLDILAQSVFKVKQEIISSSEKEILQLTIIIAEKVLKQHLEIAPDKILSIIKAAINELKDKEEVNIIVNPAITNYLYDFSEELKETVNGLKSIKILEDKTIPADGVIVESTENRIDARLETQISEIAKQLLLEAEENPILAEIPKEIEIRIEEPPGTDD